MENNKRELDIVDIMAQCYKGIKRSILEVLSWVGFFLKLTYKHKKLFILFLIGAILLSVFQTSGDRKTYTSEMILKINDGTSSLYADMVSSLDRYIQDKDYYGLAEELLLSDSIAESMRKIESYYMIDMNKDSVYDIIDKEMTFSASDTINVRMKDYITISITANDYSIMKDVEFALLGYFQDNDYLHNLNLSRIEHLVALEKQINREIAIIDSVQNLDYFTRETNSVKLTKETTINTDRQMFYFNKLDLMKKKEKVSEKLFSQEGVVSVLKPLTATSEQSNFLLETLLKNGTYLYVIFILIAFILHYKERIKDYLSKD